MNSYASISQLLRLSYIGNEAADRRNIESAIETLLARLAAVEAERDAARAEAEKEEKDCLQVIAERDEHEERLNRIFSALGMDEAESEWSSANDPAALAIEKAEELRAALLTAQAGEARAVEALRRCYEGAARQLAEPRDHDDDQYALTAIATDCEAVLADSAIALDWLAQQRREAAVEALEKLAYDADSIEGLITCNIFDLRSALCTCAAALRAGEVGDE